MLGGFYATLYPESVQQMVVDGALNPIDEIGTQEERTAADSEQLIAFEALLSEALASCDSADCPIYNDGDPTGYYLDAMAKIDLVNEERPNLDNAGLMGVISYLYSEDGWPELHGALFALAQNDDPSALAQSSDQQASESDINERDWVLCLDGWSLSSEIDRETRLGDVDAFAAEYEAMAPLLAAPLTDTYYSGFGDTILCPFLDTIAPEPLDIPFDGAEVPILVIGNPSDPATPLHRVTRTRRGHAVQRLPARSRPLSTRRVRHRWERLRGRHRAPGTHRHRVPRQPPRRLRTTVSAFPRIRPKRCMEPVAIFLDSGRGALRGVGACVSSIDRQLQPSRCRRLRRHVARLRGAADRLRR